MSKRYTLVVSIKHKLYQLFGLITDLNEEYNSYPLNF
jgi:hypothetical protein